MSKWRQLSVRLLNLTENCLHLLASSIDVDFILGDIFPN